MMSSMPKSYNFLIQTDDKCIYMAELKMHYILKECQKLFMKLKNFEKETKISLV